MNRNKTMAAPVVSDCPRRVIVQSDTIYILDNNFRFLVFLLKRKDSELFASIFMFALKKNDTKMQISRKDNISFSGTII